jgi:hypothetical protein
MGKASPNVTTAAMIADFSASRTESMRSDLLDVGPAKQA